jgi:hypothetical protein
VQTTGKWQVKWTITNHFTTDAEITSFDASSSTPVMDETTKATWGVGTVIPAAATRGGDRSISGVQEVDGTAANATLTIRLVWHDPKGPWTDNEDHEAKVVFDTQGCTKPSPSPSPSASPSPNAVPSAGASIPGGGSGGGGGLPTTGVSGIAFGGVALVLIGGGTALVLLGRRRRATE